jgi:hypothetical protein
MFIAAGGRSLFFVHFLPVTSFAAAPIINWLALLCGKLANNEARNIRRGAKSARLIANDSCENCGKVAKKPSYVADRNSNFLPPVIRRRHEAPTRPPRTWAVQ